MAIEQTKQRKSESERQREEEEERNGKKRASTKLRIIIDHH